MKILAFGDTHLGAGSEYGPRPGDRLRDQQAVLARIIEIACEEDCAAVLFAGDAFERRYPSPSELMVWRNFRDVLAHAEIPLFSIAGNHDVASADLPTGLQVLGSCGRRPEVCHIGDGMGLATLPWAPTSRIVAAQNGGDRDATHELAADLLLESARDLRTMVDGPCILLAHWSVSGASLPNGLPVDQLREPVLDVFGLAELGFDAVVLGHIHKSQLFYEGPPIFYVGSPMPLNFGEVSGHANEPLAHGVWLLDTEREPRPWLGFIPIESRPFVTVSVDLTEPIPALERPTTHEDVPESQVAGKAVLRYEDLGLDETDALAAAVSTHFPLTDAVVRLRYKATAEQARRIDLAAIRELIVDAGASKLYAIQPDIVRSDHVRVAGVDESLDEREALDLWLANEKIEEASRRASWDLFDRYFGLVRE